MAENKKQKTEAQIAAIRKAQAASVAKRSAAKKSDISKESVPSTLSDSEINMMGKNDEREMGRVLESDEKIPFIIPYDDGLPYEHQYWERSLNGLILRFKRGVQYSQPKYIVDYVKSCTDIEIQSKKNMRVYMEGAGKKLN